MEILHNKHLGPALAILVPVSLLGGAAKLTVDNRLPNVQVAVTPAQPQLDYGLKCLPDNQHLALVIQGKNYPKNVRVYLSDMTKGDFNHLVGDYPNGGDFIISASSKAQSAYAPTYLELLAGNVLGIAVIQNPNPAPLGIQEGTRLDFKTPDPKTCP